MRITTGRNVAAPRRGGPRDLALAFSPLLQQRLGVGHADATKAVSLWVWLQDSCQKAGWTYVPLPPGPPPPLPRHSRNLGSHTQICSPVLELFPGLAVGRIPCYVQAKCREAHGRHATRKFRRASTMNQGCIKGVVVLQRANQHGLQFEIGV